MDNIVIAIAKGRIEKDVYRRLKILNMEDCIETDSRKLIFTDEENKITYKAIGCGYLCGKRCGRFRDSWKRYYFGK